MKNTLLLLLLTAFTALAQGPLSPPTTSGPLVGPVPPVGAGGLPQPAMKTLHQIEPRIDLNGPPIAGVLGSDTGNEIVISAPGSYYLSRNLAVNKARGIKVDADGVTIDLMGFEIAGASGAAVVGIMIVEKSRCVVRNGNIRGFSYGLEGTLLSAFNVFEDLTFTACSVSALTASSYAKVIRCLVHNSVGSGISAYSGSILEDCMVTLCTASATTGFIAVGGPGSVLTRCSATYNTCSSGTARGISVGDNVILDACAATNNQGTSGICVGISAGDGCILRQCVASNNTGSLTGSFGISAGDRCQLLNCAANSNSCTAGVLTGSTGGGIQIFDNSVADHCTASNNKGDGIQLNGPGGIARGNTCAFNGNPAGDAAGVHAVVQTCVIEGNLVISNDRGIQASSFGTLIIQNRSAANSTSYVIATNNKVGTIVLAPFSGAISGTTGGSGVGSTDPWANLSY